MSVERFFSTSESQQRLRAGPLRRAIDGFAAWLAIEGYACRSAAAKLRFVGNLSRWLDREELGVEALDDQRVEAFLLARGPNSGRRGKATTGRQLLCYLRRSGVIPAAVSRPCSDAPIERIQRTYERFLVDERGVSPATVTNYLPIVRAFLAEHFGSREVALEMLGVRDANQFVLREARRLSRPRAKLVATVLRCLARRHRADPAPPSSGDHPDLREGRSGCAARSRTSLARRCGMTDLQQLLDEYLATRRALGVGLKLAGSLLQRFVAFAAQSEAAFITTELAWATEPRGVQPAQWANRLGMVRRFACFANAVDSRHEVPPPGLLSHRYRRSQPYLGHAHVSDTYWYLTVTPELMQLAARRLARAGRRPLT